MIAFIDDHREVNEVEPICRVLPIAPSTYYAQVAQRSDPAKISARGQRDRALCEEIRRVHEANFGVYGVRKVWRQLGREGIAVARCTGPPAARARGAWCVPRCAGPGTPPSSHNPGQDQESQAAHPTPRLSGYCWRNQEGAKAVRTMCAYGCAIWERSVNCRCFDVTMATRFPAAVCTAM